MLKRIHHQPDAAHDTADEDMKDVGEAEPVAGHEGAGEGENAQASEDATNDDEAPEGRFPIPDSSVQSLHDTEGQGSPTDKNFYDSRYYASRFQIYTPYKTFS